MRLIIQPQYPSVYPGFPSLLFSKKKTLFNCPLEQHVNVLGARILSH